MSLHKSFVLRNDTVTQAVCQFIKANAPAMAQAGTPLAVTVTEAKSKRTLEQNAKFHAMVTDIAAHAWVDGRQFSFEAWRRYLKEKFLGFEDIELPDGRIEQELKSTTSLNVEQFSTFIDQITEYAQDHLAVEFSQ